MVFDDDGGVTFVHQSLEEREELLDIGGVEADGGFLNQIKIALGRLVFAQAGVGGAGLAAAEFGYQLDALGFASAERGAGLAELEVAEAGFLEQLEGAAEARVTGKKIGGFIDAHAADVADVFAVVVDLEGGGVVAQAVAVIAGRVAAGQEGHFMLDVPIATAGLAAAALGVEGESAGGIAAGTGSRSGGEDGADVVENFQIGGGGAAAGFADRALVHFVNGFQCFQAGDGGVGFLGRLFHLGQAILHGGSQTSAHEAAFATAADTGKDGEAADGDGQIDVL